MGHHAPAEEPSPPAAGSHGDGRDRPGAPLAARQPFDSGSVSEEVPGIGRHSNGLCRLDLGGVPVATAIRGVGGLAGLRSSFPPPGRRTDAAGSTSRGDAIRCPVVARTAAGLCRTRYVPNRPVRRYHAAGAESPSRPAGAVWPIPDCQETRRGRHGFRVPGPRHATRSARSLEGASFLGQRGTTGRGAILARSSGGGHDSARESLSRLRCGPDRRHALHDDGLHRGPLAVGVHPAGQTGRGTQGRPRRPDGGAGLARGPRPRDRASRLEAGQHHDQPTRRTGNPPTWR